MNERTIFLNALDRAEGDERTAYLDQACADAPALRRRVEALLRCHARADDFLAVPAAERHGLDLTEAAGTGEERWTFLSPSGGDGVLGWLGHYAVLEKIGRGGMGIVFKCRDTKLQRVVAVKVLAPELAANGVARRRFLREARAAAALRDDHIVTVHADGDELAVPYLVMEFVAGVTLEEHVRRRGPLAVEEIVRVGAQTARGLAAAHAAGLVHRDIKPGNILLEDGTRRVKITDFGLARAADDASLTQLGVIAGSPPYMSPEQARGEGVDHRTDLFSLGSVLYTLCTGQAPFRADNTLAVLKRVCEEEPRPVRALNAAIPGWLGAVVAKLMAKDPADRFQSARDVAEVLERGPAAARRRRPRLRVAVAAGLLGLLGLAWFGRQPDPPTHRADRPSADGEERTDQTIRGTGQTPHTALNDPAHALQEVLDFRDVVGVSAAELDAWRAGLGPEFRLSLVTCRRGGGEPRFNAVAVREKTPRLVLVASGVGPELLKEDPERHLRDGFRPLNLCTYDRPDRRDAWAQWRLWVKDGRTYGFWHGNWVFVEEHMRAAAEEDCRPVCLDYLQFPNNEGFHYIGAAGPERTWECFDALGPEALPEAVSACKSKGWRPDVLAVRRENDHIRFMLVTVDNAAGPDWRFRMDMTEAQYRSESAAQGAGGFFPLALVSYGDGADIRYAAVWVRCRPPGQQPPPFQDPETVVDRAAWAVTRDGGGPKGLYADEAHALKDVLEYRDLIEATPRQFGDWYDDLPPGFHLAALTSRRGTGAVLYNAVAVRERQPHAFAFFRNQSKEQADRTWLEQDGKGYRPFLGCSHYDPGENPAEGIHAQLWVKDGLPFFVWLGNLDEVADRIGKGKADYRPIYLEWVATPNGPLFQTILGPTRGHDWDGFYGLSEEELLTTVTFYARKGWRPDVVAPYWDADRLRFMLVVTENADHVDWRFRMNMSRDEYLSESARCKTDGLFPLALTSYGNGQDVRYAAVFVRHRLPSRWFRPPPVG